MEKRPAETPASFFTVRMHIGSNEGVARRSTPKAPLSVCCPSDPFNSFYKALWLARAAVATSRSGARVQSRHVGRNDLMIRIERIERTLTDEQREHGTFARGRPDELGHQIFSRPGNVSIRTQASNSSATSARPTWRWDCYFISVANQSFTASFARIGSSIAGTDNADNSTHPASQRA
jgi:hypothetical protein